MIRNKTIKIWALITHAFIVIGMGHGILTFGIGEVVWLASVFDKPTLTDASHVTGSFLHLVALLSLIGQIAILISLYIKSRTIEPTLHLIGLALLWAGLLVYAFSIRRDNYAHLATITTLPFVYITVRTLLGRYIQNLWQHVSKN